VHLLRSDRPFTSRSSGIVGRRSSTLRGHQGQEGFRVWVSEPGGRVHEHYVVSLVDVVRTGWTVRKMP
jgi:hypothetical protein